MFALSVVLCLGISSFVLVECKECTTTSKPHLSRCDMYFKCAILPSQTIVWIPSQCDRGLIYEPGLQLCVLPSETWECTLGEPNAQQNQHDDHNVYGVNNLEYLQNEIQNYRPLFYDSSVNTDTAEAIIPKPIKSTKFESEDEEDSEDSVLMISSDPDEDEKVEVVQDFVESEEDIESSGDGQGEPLVELKGNQFNVPLSNEHETAVASNLQRLSQLIKSMSNAQENTENNRTAHSELTANDLNTFLANYNIIAGYQNQVKPQYNAQKHHMSPDGKIPADRLLEILQLQQKIQKHNANEDKPVWYKDNVGVPVRHQDNVKAPVSPVKSVRVHGKGVSAAQIVVNRPEGSVLFSLPGGLTHNSDVPNQHESDQNYLNQETLKAVLDLSKQMIASSAQQQPNYLQQTPIFRPVYYNVPVHDLPIPIISGYTENLAENRDKHLSGKNEEEKMEKVSSVNGHVDLTGDDRTTVIHNHIPITIENRKTVAKPPVSGVVESVTETRYNSFGDKVVPTHSSNYDQNSIPYPPFNEYPQKSSYYGSQNTFQQPSPHIYPPFQQSYQNIGNFPYQLQTQQHPQQQQFLPYPNQIFPTTPHLSDFNVNNYVNVHTPAYPTLRPTNAPTAPAPPLKEYNSQIKPTSYENNSDDSNVYNDDNDEESYDPNMDSNGIVYNELSSSNEPVNQRPNSDAASNLESKQSLENMLHQLKPISTGSYQSDADDENTKHKIVHYGSTFMTFQDYQQSVAPLLEQGRAQTVEVLSCVTGARQPNSQDCTKYFVCNASTQKVLDYVCPQFTAFNRQSRFCDAKTYAECKATPTTKPKITVDANRRIHLEAEQAKQELEQAKRIRDEVFRDQQLTAQLNKQTQTMLQKKRKTVVPVPRPATIAPPDNRRKVVMTTTVRPRKMLAPQKRLIKCTEPTKVRDSLSVYNYFTCFKGADGMLKALKQTCPGGLIFCERMKVCTSHDRC